MASESQSWEPHTGSNPGCPIHVKECLPLHATQAGKIIVHCRARHLKLKTLHSAPMIIDKFITDYLFWENQIAHSFLFFHLHVKDNKNLRKFSLLNDRSKVEPIQDSSTLKKKKRVLLTSLVADHRHLGVVLFGLKVKILQKGPYISMKL